MSSNKDYLSQEEIDALLRQSAEDEDVFQDEADSVSGSSIPEVNDLLTAIEQDALGEIGNITFGSAATALSTLLGQKVDITTPQVSAISKNQLEEEFPKPHVAVSVNYVEGFQGINLLVIKTKDAQVIADLMLGGDGTNIGGEMNEIHLSAVQEAMNQMMGSSATSMSTIFNRFVNISPPGIDVFDMSTGEGTESFHEYDQFIKISFRLTIGNLIDSNIMQLLPVQFAKDLVSSLMGDAMSAEPVEEEAPVAATIPEPAAEVPVAAHQAPPAAAAAYAPPPNTGQIPQQMPPMQPQYAQPAAAMPPSQAYGQPFGQPMQDFGHVNRNINVQPVQFGGFSGAPSTHADQTNLNLLLDIPLKVTVELGRTQRTIKDILELSQGSIVELDKLAGEPVDILVNNKLIAKGEVVVIDENFGVRVTDIVSQWDRIQKIQ